MTLPLWLAVLSSASVMVAVPGCKRGGQKAALPQRPPAAVTTTTAISRDTPIYLNQIGRTISVETVSVVPRVGGQIVASHVEHGQYVKAGELLFEIDPRPFEAALGSAEATLAQSRAELELANMEFRRVSEAAAAVSQLEYDQKKAAIAMAEAKVAAGEAAITSAKLNLEYSKIYSPLDGRAGARLVDAGNVVRPNDAPLLVIQRLDPIFAEFTINENDLGTVRQYLAADTLESRPGNSGETEHGLRVLVDTPGDSAQVLTALGAETPSAEPEGREGTLTFLDNSVQNGSGTVKVRATLPNGDRRFWPGQFVNVRLILTIKKDAVLIPARAQQLGQQGPFVYVIKPGSTTQPAAPPAEMPPPAAENAMKADSAGIGATKPTAPPPMLAVAEVRQVVPGQRQGEMIVVEKGLSAGEQVVLTGQNAIPQDGKVMLVPGAQDAPEPTTTQSAETQPDAGMTPNEENSTSTESKPK